MKLNLKDGRLFIADIEHDTFLSGRYIGNENYIGHIICLNADESLHYVPAGRVDCGKFQGEDKLFNRFFEKLEIGTPEKMIDSNIRYEQNTHTRKSIFLSLFHNILQTNFVWIDSALLSLFKKDFEYFRGGQEPHNPLLIRDSAGKYVGLVSPYKGPQSITDAMKYFMERRPHDLSQQTA